MDGSSSSFMSPPHNLQLNENVDLDAVTIKTEAEDSDNDDGLRVQVLNLYCYECRQLFSDSDSFHLHVDSFHNQNQKENPVLKPKKKYKTRVNADNSKLKTKANKNQRISTILKNTNSWNNYDEDEYCLEGKDRILVECKKCRKNYTSLTGFIKHLRNKKKKKKIVQKEDDSQQNLSFAFEQQLSMLQENDEYQNETKPEVEEHGDFDVDSNFSTSIPQVQNEKGQDSDEWSPESEYENNLKKKKRTSSKSPKKKSTKTIKPKTGKNKLGSQTAQNLNENYHEEKSLPSSIEQNEESSTSVSLPSSSTASSSKKNGSKNPSKPRPSPKCCNMCNFSTLHIKDLREHKRTAHEKEKPFMCHLCSDFFKCEAYLKRHMKVHEERKAVKCPECGKGFGDANHRNIHMAVHREERPYLCPEPSCPFATLGFKFKTNLTSHFIGVHKNPEEMSQCSQCDKSFKTKTLLRCHMRIHAEGRSKSFVCSHPGCDKAYFYAYQLANHQKDNHSVIKEKVHCPICNKGFKQLQVMKTHRRIVHDQQKNYVCDVCGKGFGKGYSLKVHQRSHTGVRLFPCVLCPKAYTTKQQLINHNLKCHPSQNEFTLPPQNQNQNFFPSTQPPNNNNYYPG